MKLFQSSVIAVLAALFIACSPQEAPPSADMPMVRPAKTVRVQAGSHTMRSFPGVVEAAQKSDLAFRVSGQLVELRALPGMTFREGDLLGRLDDAEFRSALLDRQARFRLAKSQYDKVTRLHRNGHASESDVEQVEANLQAAQSALTVAEDNLHYTHLLAPFNGVIAGLYTENYQMVNARQTVMHLHSDTVLEVRFSVPESLLGRLKHIEDPSRLCALVRFDAYAARPYEACFKEYESTPDALTSTYSVVYALPAINDFAVLPGMSVAIDIDLSPLLNEQPISGVLVPPEAVFEEGGGSWVWKVDNNSKVTKIAVQLAGVQGDQLHVLSGLNTGDIIVAAGVEFIQEGQMIAPIKKERGL